MEEVRGELLEGIRRKEDSNQEVKKLFQTHSHLGHIWKFLILQIISQKAAKVKGGMFKDTLSGYYIDTDGLPKFISSVCTQKNQEFSSDPDGRWNLPSQITNKE